MIKREDGSRIWLSEPLSYRHSGLGVLRAEVALLHRNIVIRGGNEAAPFDWEGESGTRRNFLRGRALCRRHPLGCFASSVGNSTKLCRTHGILMLSRVSFHFHSIWTGGHFMVYMTATPQFIEGVQFKLLGSQGLIGHYPIHFHVCGDAEHKSVVRKNAIVDSKQVREKEGH